MSEIVQINQINGRLEDLSEKVKEAKDKLERRTLNVKELGSVIGCGDTKARELMKSKGFPSFRIGNRWLVSTSRFEEWLNNTAGKEF